MDFTVGLDVGSTTVKAVLVGGGDSPVWKKYARHGSLQAETALAFLDECRAENGLDSFRLFTTGSGGGPIADAFGTKHYQEVNALCAAVERLNPGAGSVFEIGGQDSKFVTWRGGNGKFSAMNDRCAGGTGATIDRIVAKLNLSEESVRAIPYDENSVYPVAGKCGVFAETDINSLQKQGIPGEALVVSLFDAVVGQNLAVLSRGYTPLPDVLLLGGPNVFLPGLQAAWRCRLASLWRERGIAFEGARGERRGSCPAPAPPAHGRSPSGGGVYVPENALYYGALGAAYMGRAEGVEAPPLRDLSPLVRLLEEKRKSRFMDSIRVFFKDRREREAFFREHAATGHGATKKGRRLAHRPSCKAARRETPPETGAVLAGYIGIDGGSTSTKGVVLDAAGGLAASAYAISQGNPLEDARRILFALRDSVGRAGASLEPRAIGYTGYAKDLLFDAFGGTAKVVETVAHSLGARAYFPDAEVICDVGGQDIKVILLREGVIRDFRLNTQCSAGNGYYLQATAGRFGIPVERYAEAAFAAGRAPVFNFGCAVFLESDIVNFQQLGWRAEEIMAGLARVVPENVWLYVVQEANLAKLGRVFVLQGGTHKNLAVVKAQEDFIRSRVPDARIRLHPHGDVAGAIGAAIEAMGAAPSRDSDFIGFENLEKLDVGARREGRARCGLCGNACSRTVITVRAGEAVRSFVVAQCERGMGNEEPRREAALGTEGGAPNFVKLYNRIAFRRSSPPSERKNRSLANAVIGIPRALNIYSCASFFRSYFERLGAGEVRFSSCTSERLRKRALGRGSIDPCFPAKVAVAHVCDLIEQGGVTHVFFPCIKTLRGEIGSDEGHWSCPAVCATPEVVKAALTLETDEFARRGVIYLDPVLDMAEWDLLERQMHMALGRVFPIGRRENRDAMEYARAVWERDLNELRRRAEEVLEGLERTGGTGIVVLARPYHNDPGIHHGIVEQLNRRGYPIFGIESLPRDGPRAERLFGRDIREGTVGHLLDVRDVWPNCFSENTSLKVWAAKFAARHPNLAAIDLSSFRCGHDAPLHSVIGDIFTNSGAPCFAFHEIDENTPAGSIRLRVETIDYFLSRRDARGGGAGVSLRDSRPRGASGGLRKRAPAGKAGARHCPSRAAPEPRGFPLCR